MTTSTATTLKTWTGEHVKIELYQDGDVLVYQMTGQSIAEQVGASRQNVDDLLETLLSPMGLTAFGDGSIHDVKALLDAGQPMIPGVVIIDGPFASADEAFDRAGEIEDERDAPPFPVQWEGLDGQFYVIERPDWVDFRPLTSEDLGGLKFLIGIKRDAVANTELEGWDAAKARRDARNAEHRQAMIAAGFMTEDGDPILPDWFSDDLAH